MYLTKVFEQTPANEVFPRPPSFVKQSEALLFRRHDSRWTKRNDKPIKRPAVACGTADTAWRAISRCGLRTLLCTQSLGIFSDWTEPGVSLVVVGRWSQISQSPPLFVRRDMKADCARFGGYCTIAHVLCVCCVRTRRLSLSCNTVDSVCCVVSYGSSSTPSLPRQLLVRLPVLLRRLIYNILRHLNTLLAFETRRGKPVSEILLHIISIVLFHMRSYTCCNIPCRNFPDFDPLHTYLPAKIVSYRA